MKFNLHLTTKPVFTILLNKASYKNGFVLSTPKKVSKRLVKFYKSIDKKIVPLEKKDVFAVFNQKYSWGGL